MQILETPIHTAWLKGSSQQTDLSTSHEKRVLIAEDDLTLQPLWQMMLKRRNENIRIDWATSMEEAERLLRFRYKSGAPYHMVIADIFLEGHGSGIDLWNRYGEEAKTFVFVSALPLSRYELLMSLNYGCPLYFKKPLDTKKYGEIIELIAEAGD